MSRLCRYGTCVAIPGLMAPEVVRSKLVSIQGLMELNLQRTVLLEPHNERSKVVLDAHGVCRVPVTVKRLLVSL